MNTAQAVSKKVILVGNFGVGKTSLTRQFVHQKFSNDYLTTIGVKVDKKELQLSGRTINLLLWDVAGEISQTKVHKSYYLGSQGVIYVFDVTRPATFEGITDDLNYIQELLPEAPIMCIGNKVDLLTLEEIDNLDVPYDYLSSAKTGENVEKMFEDLTYQMLQQP